MTCHQTRRDVIWADQHPGQGDGRRLIPITLRRWPGAVGEPTSRADRFPLRCLAIAPGLTALELNDNFLAVVAVSSGVFAGAILAVA